MIAYIIFCDAKPQFVVINDEERAVAKMNELREKHYYKKSQFFRSRLDYERRIEWVIYSVNGELKCLKT